VTPYLDASALVKRYVAEPGTAEVIALTSTAAAVATALISRAEVAAAFARAVRMGVLDGASGRRAQRRFAREWPDFVRVPVTEALVARAETLAWDHGLRGYDAVQLATALAWQDSVGQEVVLATFDRQLWETAPRVGLRAWPAAWPRQSRAEALRRERNQE
jgi:predicted nucleic acid-binding protein